MPKVELGIGVGPAPARLATIVTVTISALRRSVPVAWPSLGAAWNASQTRTVKAKASPFQESFQKLFVMRLRGNTLFALGGGTAVLLARGGIPCGLATMTYHPFG